jgi:hypothetical protein
MSIVEGGGFQWSLSSVKRGDLEGASMQKCSPGFHLHYWILLISALMFWLPLNFEMPAPDEVDCQEGKVIEAYKEEG